MTEEDAPADARPSSSPAPPELAIAAAAAAGAGETADKLRKDEAVRALKRADTAKAHELLFEAWDRDGNGRVALADVEAGIEALQDHEGKEIHLQYVAVSAASALEQLDTRGYQQLDPPTFRAFVGELTQGMGKPFSIVSELLILAAPATRAGGDVLLPDVQGLSEEQAQQAERLAAVVQDPQVEALFVHFSSEAGVVGLLELCHMLHRLRRDVSLHEARAQAVSTMLLCDTESKRALERPEFSRLLQRLASLLHMEAGALAGVLVQLARGEAAELGPGDAAATASMRGRDTVAQVYESLADRKLHLLFELWDKDGDGALSFSELALGMRKFCPRDEPITETAADAVEALLLFDADADQRLDRSDFAWFVNQLCEACGSDFPTMAEFLILLAALEDNPPEELAFLLSEDKVERAVSIACLRRPGPEANPFTADAAQPGPSQRAVAVADSPFADAPAPPLGTLPPVAATAPAAAEAADVAVPSN